MRRILCAVLLLSLAALCGCRFTEDRAWYDNATPSTAQALF